VALQSDPLHEIPPRCVYVTDVANHELGIGQPEIPTELPPPLSTEALVFSTCVTQKDPATTDSCAQIA